MITETEYQNLLKQLSDLNKENAIYKSIINKLPVAVFAKDAKEDLNFVIWNQEMEKTFGLQAEEVLGKNDYHLFKAREDAEYFREIDRYILDKDGIMDFPNEDIDTPFGKKIVHTRKTTIKNELNEGILLLGSLEDVTQKIKTEKALIESEKVLNELNQSKDKFISILAHDLKNPFNVLIGFSEILLENIDDLAKDEIESYCKIINKTANHTYNLLEELLIWSQSNNKNIPLNKTSIQLIPFIDEIIEPLKSSASNKDITINVTISAGFNVNADTTMLKTVLRNLISNAIKFTYRGGSINIKAYDENGQTHILVSDTGIGMSSEELERLWLIGNQHRSKGTEEEKGSGFGLLLCKEFIERHDGKIWAEGQPQKGSTFYISIPN